MTRPDNQTHEQSRLQRLGEGESIFDPADTQYWPGLDGTERV